MRAVNGSRTSGFRFRRASLHTSFAIATQVVSSLMFTIHVSSPGVLYDLVDNCSHMAPEACCEAIAAFRWSRRATSWAWRFVLMSFTAIHTEADWERRKPEKMLLWV